MICLTKGEDYIFYDGQNWYLVRVRLWGLIHALHKYEWKLLIKVSLLYYDDLDA